MITENIERAKPLHLSHSFKASAAKVFDAWTIPSIAEQWLFKSATNILHFQIDLQEGGEFSVVENDEGPTILHFGEYLKISKPDTLVFTLAVPEHFEGVSVVRVDIEVTGEGCQLSLTQTNIDTSKTEQAWREMLDRLQVVLNQDTYMTGYYEAINAKQSTLIRMVLEDHNTPYRLEHNINPDGHPTERYFVDDMNDEWMQEQISAIDLALENASDADLLRRLTMNSKAMSPFSNSMAEFSI